MIEIIAAAFKLMLLVLGEYFSWISEQNTLKRAVVLDEATKRNLFNKALAKLLADAKTDAGSAQNVENQIDKDLKG